MHKPCERSIQTKSHTEWVGGHEISPLYEKLGVTESCLRKCGPFWVEHPPIEAYTRKNTEVTAIAAVGLFSSTTSLVESMIHFKRFPEISMFCNFIFSSHNLDYMMFPDKGRTRNNDTKSRLLCPGFSERRKHVHIGLLK